MKVFGAVIMASLSDRERLDTTRRCDQIRVIVAASSQAKAAALFGVTVGFLRNYGGPTGNQKELDAVSKVPPGTVLMRALDDHRGEYIEREVTL